MATSVHAFVEGRLDNQLIDTEFLVQDNKTKTLDYERDVLKLDQFMV